MGNMSLFEMMDAVDNRVKDLMHKFKERYLGYTTYNVITPKILFSKRGTTAGTSLFNLRTGVGSLNFNRILMTENWDDFDQTIVHEVAHHCTNTLEGNVKSHGKEWKRMMSFFGVRADRCHKYDTSTVTSVRAPRKTYKYSCSCTVHNISSIRHKRILTIGKNYVCRKCGNGIKIVVDNP